MDFFEACQTAFEEKRHVSNGYYDVSYEDTLDSFQMSAIGGSGVTIFQDPECEYGKYNEEFLRNIEDGWEID